MIKVSGTITQILIESRQPYSDSLRESKDARYEEFYAVVELQGDDGMYFFNTPGVMRCVPNNPALPTTFKFPAKGNMFLHVTDNGWIDITVFEGDTIIVDGRLQENNRLTHVQMIDANKHPELI